MKNNSKILRGVFELRKKEIDKVTVKPDEKLKDALPKMEQGGMQVLLVVDDKNHLLGIITDGDIRRLLLKNGNLDTPVCEIMNADPKSVKIGTSLNYIKDMMLKNNIRHVPILDEQRHLIDLVLWVDVFSKKRILRKEKVVIMAGGKGTRLAPFTKILPKPMIPIGDKPMIEIIMDKFYDHGFEHFILSVGYKAEIIKMYFNDESNIRPYRIDFIQEEEPLGTAGALYFLRGKIKDTFVVTNCDIIVEADWGNVLDFHKDRKNFLTIVASLKKFTIPYGVMKTEDGVLIDIEEKPDFHFLVNTGVYVLEPELLALFSEQKFLHMPEVIEMAKENGFKVGVYPHHGKWFDIGQWEEYRQTIKALEV